ncbi:MAG: hypothetical protein WDN75_20540 [Bacteroidota bacterium]
MLTSFRDFIKQINKNGTLVIHKSVESLAESNVNISKKTYSIDLGPIFCQQS